MIVKHRLSIIHAIIFFYLLVSSSLQSDAQLNSGNLTRFTEKDGLPGAEVHTVLPDRFGYIWVGTINGLARYDGYEFKRFYFNPNDSTSLHGLNVWSLYQDRSGLIWIGAAPTYLNSYNPATKTFRQYDFAQLVPHAANTEPGITAECEDNNGRIYFGVGTNYGEPISQALLYKDKNEDKLKRFDTPDSMQIQNVARLTRDSTGNIWILSYSGLFKVDVNRKLSRFYNLDAEFNNDNYPADLKFDKEGHMWMITSMLSLYDVDPGTGKYKVWPLGKTDTSAKNFPHKVIIMDKEENLWIGTGERVTYFNRATGKFFNFNNGSKKELEHTPVTDLALDSFGNLWIGSKTDGLIKYEEKTQFKSYTFNPTDKKSITGGWANNIVEDHYGKIWITTSGPANVSGITILDPRTGSLQPILYSGFLKNTADASSLWENSPGEMYLGLYYRKIYTLSEKTLAAKPVAPPGIPDSVSIFYHLIDSRGNEWLCSTSGIYKKIIGTQSFKRYDLSVIAGSNASSNEITRAFESKKHGLWLVTNNGLFIYNYTTDKIERLGYDKSKGDVFMTQDVNSFYESPDGIAWVGTWQGGLSRYNIETKKIKTYTRNDGLSSMSIQSILADEKTGYLWLATFDGLSRFNLKTEQFNNFSIADGIQGQLFADGSFLKTASGLFIFGGSNGITVFNPDSINQTSIPPKVFLTDFKLFNQSILPGENSILKKPIYETEQVMLPYNKNNISIEFIAIHYSDPAKNKYSYKLENYDNEWRNVGDQHEAFYPNLPPGKYLFRVKAANNNGVWSEKGATLKIIVNPPWWRTTLAYILYAILLIVLGFAADRYFRKRILRKEREKARGRELEQAKEIEKAYHKLEETHETLKATQSQLIQSEKMASLGELTAGIAHEIQNPLNFVNNFSEVNKELIEEIQSARSKVNGEKNEQLQDELLNTIKDNEEKINHHGKRADAIVKGMLQHSRSSTGVKESTDINALADEYLRLTYHGIRAKDKEFNVTIKTDFDNTIGKINIIPQDIGRVLLNLYNNAFYAVAERLRQSQPDSNYKPTVSVTTKKINNSLTITVSDNGNGIPQKVIDKIFQPFFTTKPTGQGTGLGLSLAYDIITKEHNGTIKVESKEDEGSTFIIQLPITA